MPSGYPDYTRLSAAGGFELATVSGAVASGTTVFQGFVGNWPYQDLYVALAAGTDFAQITIAYYPDSSYTTSAGSQVITRASGTRGNTQYAVLAPWAVITVQTVSGAAITFTALNVYGAYGSAGAARLAGLAGPVYAIDANIAATTNRTDNVASVVPGPAVLSVATNAATWTIYLWYYSFATAGYHIMWKVDNTIAAKGGSWPVALPDVPMQIEEVNGDTGTRLFVVGLVSASY